MSDLEGGWTDKQVEDLKFQYYGNMQGSVMGCLLDDHKINRRKSELCLLCGVWSRSRIGKSCRTRKISAPGQVKRFLTI